MVGSEGWVKRTCESGTPSGQEVSGTRYQTKYSIMERTYRMVDKKKVDKLKDKKQTNEKTTNKSMNYLMTELKSRQMD